MKVSLRLRCMLVGDPNEMWWWDSPYDGKVFVETTTFDTKEQALAAAKEIGNSVELEFATEEPTTMVAAVPEDDKEV